MGVIYEVTVHARADIARDYLAWLRGHVEAMLGLPGFESAELHAVLEPAEDARGWCIRYRLRDRAALEDYLRDHAPRMRAEGIERFGDAFRAQRRVLATLEDPACG